jgi:glycolate oxidase FAD binding subunit
MTSATEILDLVRDSAASRTPLRIAGRSHWMDAGRPVDATRIASLAAHSGVVDYVPGDLTITVRAGTTLDEIERVTGAEGQWLPLDPFGSTNGTIGATIATGSFGPLAHGFGRARDLVLGVEFVTGDGRTVRGGGRVVKNVAGFDLVRLVTGSWGTIGVVTEATLRLYSRPLTSLTVAMSVPEGPQQLSQRLTSILAAPITALAVELISPGIAGRIGLPRRPTALIELGGNAASVMAQRDSLSRLGGMTEIADSPWAPLRTVEASVNTPPAVVRLSALPSRIGEVWSEAARVLETVNDAMMHATPGLGIVRCIVPGGDPAALRALTTLSGKVTVVPERLPAGMWLELSASVVSDRLSQGIMKAFDPSHILNPGILGPLS